MRELIERLEKRAEEDEECARNSETVAEALAGELAKFEARDAPWNTYAVRMAVDHRTSAKRDRGLAADLRQAIAILRAKEDSA